ncbi:winged helix-turn-helix domain-containing protein [Shewanella sp. 1_MG-2023]|uniref:Winged helix-turn-helix domain-containing protein n=1 Tax=Shewanella electrodiphila TaxID=934143 RepID=A0ABT0KNG2_9GAMM|nr:MULTISPECIES: winged helix-turn-helix domain-containing protein [unclassified Shewanella]MCL1045390.1 winged helix-turn-helix domain-containing protein [Shewanella electrodiphila]MDO6611344.1 winged helix-turn-helix domain-containing protein [Shewanella sp. 7_MG-2023]MDO6771199.1 winged helix-turn-helix domain-containing protein [Shewanella sp. 2_MG-2023]MDO6795440.1 winged helix-turn-helix domain-containing protein [Shewanella sp. 1_MG-2023]
MGKVMQLGHCKFDVNKGELVNNQSDEVWRLPRAELQVLTLLIDYQGKVVAKPLLKTGNGQEQPLSDASVTHAIFTLRAFLGPQYESLIETVKGQGYLLKHHRSRKQSVNFFSHPQRFAIIAIITLAVALLISGLMFIRFSPPKALPVLPNSTATVKLTSGQTVDVILYSSSKTNLALLKKQGMQLQQSLAQCNSTSWKRVFLSLSHDEQVLNITLRGEHYGQSVIRNLKISDLRQPKKFVSQAWLKGVEICD